MRILIIHCHPVRDSFGAALRDAVVRGLNKPRHSVELRDLYAENFDPVLPARQREGYFNETDNGSGLEQHIAALRQAEALVLVYPTWWFGMPAMLKGWFDRVWLPGVAFRVGGMKVLQPLLTGVKQIAVVTTYGSPWWMLCWVGWPDKRIAYKGLRPLCAKDCRIQWLGLTWMDRDSPARRKRFLTRVERHFSSWR